MEKSIENINCPKCEIIIRPPYFACLQKHITCRKCVQHIDLVTAEAVDSTDCPKELFELKILNKTYENVFDLCQFGCGHRDNPLKLGEHETKYHQQGPFSTCAIGSCKWTGSLRDLINHVWYKHGSKFMDLSNKETVFYIDEDIKICLVTQFYHENYTNEVYWIRIAQRDEKKFVLMVHEGRIGASDEGIDERIKEFTVSSVNHQDQAVTSKTFLKGGDILDTNFVVEKGTDISSLESKSFIVNTKRTAPEIPEMIFNMLKCTICDELMTPPIRQCESGHSCCETCGKKSKICPKCDKNVTAVRNIALEELRDNFGASCRNGCFATGTKERMSEHIKKCDFRITKCASRNCYRNWKGPYKTYLKHLNVSHYNTIKSNGSSFTYKGWNDYFYHIEGHFFIFLLLQKPSTYIFSVYEITDESHSDFTGIIEFSNPMTKEAITFKGSCKAATASNIESDDFLTETGIFLINSEWFDKNLNDEYGQFTRRLHIYRSASNDNVNSGSKVT